ncbi:MAG: peptide chain release factor 1 [bacterium]
MNITPEIRGKLENMEKRLAELERRMAAPDAARNNGFRDAAREYNRLAPPVSAFRELLDVERETCKCEELLRTETEEDVLRLCRDELKTLNAKREKKENLLAERLSDAVAPDVKSFIMEIRSGAGGSEAALFAGDLYRMYTRYAEKKGWRTENLSSHPTTLGGFKEVVFAVNGAGAYAALRYESGVHRVQRVPVTESGGRIHTSTVTVAALIEPDEIEVRLDPSDVRVDTFRSSSAGGQHVNKTDSAVRITHLPSGMVVECQDERSQHQNREKAFRLLRARLMEKLRAEQQEKLARERRSQVGSGDRSERIRTYNFPQGRVSDHRAGVTLYRLQELLDGGLDELLEPLRRALRAKEIEEKLADV